MEEIEDFLGQGRADPIHGGQVGQAGPGHGAGGTEVLQQGALPARTDTGDLVQRIGADGGAALLAMAADDKTVRFVAQPLQVIENGTFHIQPDDLPVEGF